MVPDDVGVVVVVDETTFGFLEDRKSRGLEMSFPDVEVVKE